MQIIKILKYLLYSFLILISIVFFYKESQENYRKHLNIKNSIIEHPSFIPTENFLKITSFGFNNLKADLLWIDTIQYIGANVLDSSYKKYLFNMLNLITDLNPYFIHPYTVGELLLPGYNEKFESLTKEEIKIHNNEAKKIGLKGIKNLCNQNKINLIKKEYNFKKIWTNPKYYNPCKTYKIPYYLGFIYYYYLKQPLKASLYYKIASANKNSLKGIKLMASIMQGKGGDREKSIFMFLNLAQITNGNNKNKICSNLSSVLENIYFNVYKNKIKLNGKIIKNIEKTRKKIFGNKKGQIQINVTHDNCGFYLLKAIREINLDYLDKANKKYKLNTGKYAKTPEELYKKGYINFIPTDYQQYKTYGIKYILNKDTGLFEAKMTNYNNKLKKK